MKTGQYRDIGNIGHKTKGKWRLDNTETQETLDIRGRGNEDWTIQRHRKHWTSDARTNTSTNKQRKTKKMCNTDLTKIPGWFHVLANGKTLLCHIRNLSCCLKWMKFTTKLLIKNNINIYCKLRNMRHWAQYTSRRETQKTKNMCNADPPTYRG